MKTICFTGPRPKNLYGYNHDAYLPLLETIKMVCIDFIETESCIRFISGGAQGVDQLAFWAVNSLKTKYPHIEIKNDVFIPFIGQESKWQKDGVFGQKQYNMMLSLADCVYNTSNKTLNDYTSKMLTERNHAMVNESDIVIAVFSMFKNPMYSSGGTAECLRYAMMKNKTIFTIDPHTNNVIDNI